MTAREKIAIGTLISIIFLLYILRIFVEQQLVMADVEYATLKEKRELLEGEYVLLQESLLTQTSLTTIAERAKTLGFIPCTCAVVIEKHTRGQLYGPTIKE